MISIDSASTRSTASTPSARAREFATPKSFWIARAFTIMTAIGLQLVGLYAPNVTFGAWITVGLYAVGGLTVLLQRVIAERRVASWPAGD